MKILFVSHAPLERELGASKVVIEVAEGMERLGWTCDVTSLMELVPGPIQPGGEVYGVALREHLLKHAAEYDVVDYDHVYLPYPRGEFAPRTLFVARSVLLAHHLSAVRSPASVSLKSRVRALISGGRNHVPLLNIVERATRTISEADLVNVANRGDEATLVGSGVLKEKIVVIPYGLTRERRILFERGASTPREAKIAFLGTFDARKGADDLPAIVSSILGELPEASFRLLGTGVGAQDVLAKFPRRLRSRIEVIPKYPTSALPEFLASCSIGVFPSYVEGFGFGVLEMLAAGVPVFAYDAPGPPMMLPPDYLVPLGDKAEIARRVVSLARNASLLEAARLWARERSHKFDWADIAKQTADAYLARWREKNAGPSFDGRSAG